MKSHVHINIGGFHDWQLLQSRASLPDGVHVLDGLTFGWLMPPTGLCPGQPDPMQATFALNVPSFPDVNDIATGDPVRIEVAFVADGWTTDDTIPDPLFAFYGRVSDVSATPRPGRPGVTLSVVAVDTTVDPADIEPWSYPTDSTNTKGYVEVLTQLWADRPAGLGALPDWPITPTDGPDVTVSGSNAQAPLQVIYDVLLVAVSDPAAATVERVILAPLVDVDFQWYAFDTVRKVPDPADVYVIDGTRIERESMRWQRLKRSLVNAVEATGSSESGAVGAPAVWPGTGNKVQEEISTISASSDELTTVAEFYLPDPAASGSWTLDTFTLLVSYLDDDALTAVPNDLFPRWKDAEGSVSRSACYSKLIRLTNLDDNGNAFHEDPDPGPDLDGILSGATLTIVRGRVALALTVRQLQPHTP